MNKEDRMIWMYNEIHEALTGSCYLEVTNPESWEEGEATISVMKDGNLCYSYTLSELTFDYVTRHLD